MIWLMIDPKTSYEIDSVGHSIAFPTHHFNLKFSLQLSHIEYFSWEYMPLKW